MKRVNLSLQNTNGIGFSDAVVSLVVASVIAIIFYNVYSKLKTSKEEEVLRSYMEQNANKAVKAIVDDLTNSLMYGAWCGKKDLIQLKDGGASSSDEITILTGTSSGAKVLREDMKPDTFQIPVDLGSKFETSQKLAICDETNIEWFTLKEIEADKDIGMSLIMPLSTDAAQPFTKLFLKGSVVGAFEKVEYLVRASSDGDTAVYRRVLGSNNAELIAQGIENLQVELIKGDGLAAASDNVFLQDIHKVRLVLVAKTEKEDSSFTGFHSLSGFPDGYRRIEVIASIPFQPLDTKFLEGISYKISWDAQTGKPKPAFFKSPG